MRQLEEWMRSYRPEELFDQNGRLIEELRELPPKGDRRMSANPVANGGRLRRTLKLPDFKDYAVPMEGPGKVQVENTRLMGRLLKDVIAANPTNFRLFGPDETLSNRLGEVFEVTSRAWMGDYLPEDQDGGFLSPIGRVMEMLSEHTLQGWLEGYLLTGSARLFSHLRSLCPRSRFDV